MQIQGKTLFPLTKLRDGIPDDLYMDARGNVYQEIGRRLDRCSVYWPAVYDAARKHPDWAKETGAA